MIRRSSFIAAIRKAVTLLASTDIFLAAVFWLIVLTVIGTVAQSHIGLYQAQTKYFSACFIWIRFLPLPAGRLTLIIIFVNLCTKLFFFTPFEKKKIGIIICHWGVVILLLGGFISACFSQEWVMVLKEGQTVNRIVSERVGRQKITTLPFSIHLEDFIKKFHPGTEIAKSYRSHINLINNDIERKVIIRMNEPLRYKGYTFYQSSYKETPHGEVSILAVVRNVGKYFPYIASIILCLGLMIHLIIYLPEFVQKS